MSLLVFSGSVEQGLIYGLVALALLVSYRVLDIADLTVDGSFTLGAGASAMLVLAGHPLLAAYTAYKSGHALNNKLMRAVLADASSYEIVSFDDERSAPQGLAALAPAW